MKWAEFKKKVTQQSVKVSMQVSGKLLCLYLSQNFFMENATTLMPMTASGLQWHSNGPPMALQSLQSGLQWARPVLRAHCILDGIVANLPQQLAAALRARLLNSPKRPAHALAPVNCCTTSQLSTYSTPYSFLAHYWQTILAHPGHSIS